MKTKVKKRSLPLILILSSLLVISILINIAFFVSKPAKEIEILEKIQAPDLSTKDFVKVTVSVEPEVIYLIHNCSALVMFVSRQQSYSIKTGIENITDFRPTTHDITGNVLEMFDINVLMVKIVDMKEGTYYANIFLKRENKILNLDSRPSDAIAIAVRDSAPVYAKEELFELYGEKIC